MGATRQLERPAGLPPQQPSRPERSKLARGSLLPLDRSSDERLARRATRGDERALGAIFERYQQELYRFCLGLLGEPQDAQDALQNTMVKALRALPGEKREIALRPWLYRVAHNEAIDLRRTKRDTQTLDGHLLDAHSNVAERAEHRERLEWLFRDLSDLPERQRAVLVMRELSGLDFADIGAALGTSGAVVRQALYEARRNLEQMDFGRGMRCEAIMRVLSNADGRVSGRREIRAHLRDCPGCRRFQDRIQGRKETFAGIAPLSSGLAGGILQSALTGTGGSGAGGIAAALGGSAAKSVGTVGALKAVAAVAAVAVIGTVAVDRNLQEHRLPGGEVPAALSHRGHVAHVPSPAAKLHSPRQTPAPIHGREAVPAPIAPGAVGSHRPGVSAAHRRASDDQVVASGGHRSVQAAPAVGKSPTPPTEATNAPAKAEKQQKAAESAAKQEERAAKDEAKRHEKATKAEAKSKPEHPEHPSHPGHSQKPAGVPVPPEERPEEAETAPSPEAEGSPESIAHSPNGKARGHEKQLSD
jgi:RNA polymerase sigma factor (sigma-70 family)